MTTGPSPVGCIETIIPILNVRNLESSLRYYVDVLGFTIDWTWGEPAEFGSASRDRQSIMFCEGGQGHAGTWLWIGVEDIDPLYEAFSARGATFLERPTSYPWAYEMRVVDPDGHVLRFGSEARNGHDAAATT